MKHHCSDHKSEVHLVKCTTIGKHHFFSNKSIFSYSSVLTYVLDAQKEPSHRDGSFEYPQHMYWFRNKKTIFYHPPITTGLKNL